MDYKWKKPSERDLDKIALLPRARRQAAGVRNQITLLVDLERQRNNLNYSINVLAEKIKAACSHPLSLIEVGEIYFEGSYNDKASTSYYARCTGCHFLWSTGSETHGWYG